jgi:putative transposase
MISLLDCSNALGLRKALCESLGLPRATFYRLMKSDQFQAISESKLLVELKQLAKDFPSYGYRRLRAELCKLGYQVSRKKVLSLMRQHRLLCKRRRRYIATTDSNHGCKVYPNLAPQICLTAVNQLWLSDITYIRLPDRFIYLAVTMDSFSRRVIGWSLSNRIDTKLTLDALNMAIGRRGAPLYHHSDRGVQYASTEYAAALASHQVQMSMSRTGNPYDNARMESFMKTLKYELVYRDDYRTFDQAKKSLTEFLGAEYNDLRIHSALDYLTPTEFETKHQSK